MMGTKNDFINLRLEQDTKTTLERLADAMKISKSAIVRQLIDMGLAEMFKLDYVRQAYNREYPVDQLVTKYYEQRSEHGDY
jgi:predicted DNA-binding protein